MDRLREDFFGKQLDQLDGEGMKPSLSQIQHVYENTGVDSPLRKFLVDRWINGSEGMIDCAVEDEFQEIVTASLPGFLFDTLKETTRTASRLFAAIVEDYSASDSDPDELNVRLKGLGWAVQREALEHEKCDYHLHVQGKCPSGNSLALQWEWSEV